MAAHAATRARARLEATAEPNVIPFIDVLLVLLIVFMVTAPKPTTDIRLDLTPRTEGPASLIPPTVVQLREAPGGGYRVFVGDEETTLDQVSERTMAHLLAANPQITVVDAQADARVFVRSDLDVAYANVVAVVDDLQQARFQKVAVIAQNADSDG
jgi:biopolymer transport protein ExbD